MDFLPYLVVWFLLAAIPLAAILLPRPSSILPILSIALTLVALVIWFFARPAATITLTFAPWPAEASPAGWGWRMDDINWQLTGIALWLLLGLLVSITAVPPFARPGQPAIVGLLPAVLLAALWSATPATLITTWTLFAAVCWATVQTTNRIRNWRLIPWLLLPILLYSLAVVLAGASAAGGVVTSAWTSVAISFALLAAAIQMGFWAFATQMTGGNAQPMNILLCLLPSLIGVALLARLVTAVAIPFSTGLLATIIAMIAILAGVWLAWGGPTTNKTRSSEPATGLSLALAGVAFLSGLWAGPESLIAATRVLIFVSAALFLIGERRSRRAGEQRSRGAGEHLPVSYSPLPTPHSPLHLFRPPILALAVAFLAIAGLPPTAGFASLAPLYGAWLNGIHVLLVLALVLLLIPLLAITYRFTQRLVRSYAIATRTNNDPAQRPPGYRFWPAELAPLLLVIGTFAPGGYPISQVTNGTWVALFAATLGGLLLPHFLRQTRSIRGALREAMTFRPLQDRLPGTVRHLTTPVVDAFVDAYTILESDAGLLWLLALLLLFWWIS